MSKLVRDEEKASRVTKPYYMENHPSLMVIPTYAQLQKERSLKQDIIKARFYNAFYPSDNSALPIRSKHTQTSLDFFDKGIDIQLRAEIASKDLVICSLNEKISNIEKLNVQLNSQLLKSSFAHSDKDDDIANLKSELENLKRELQIKDIFLVDHEGSKKRESQMVGKLAKQHMVILRLSQNLDLCRKHILEMSTRTPRALYNVNAKEMPTDARRTDWDDELGMLFNCVPIIDSVEDDLHGISPR